MTIDNFNKENLKMLRIDLEKELKSLGNRFGVIFQLNRISFDNKKFHCKLEGRVCSEKESFMEIEFKENAYKYGLVPDDLGKIFSINDKTYKITGLKVKNRKYPIIAENISNGKSYKFSIFAIKMELMKRRKNR